MFGHVTEQGVGGGPCAGESLKVMMRADLMDARLIAERVCPCLALSLVVADRCTSAMFISNARGLVTWQICIDQHTTNASVAHGQQRFPH